MAKGSGGTGRGGGGGGNDYNVGQQTFDKLTRDGAVRTLTSRDGRTQVNVAITI